MAIVADGNLAGGQEASVDRALPVLVGKIEPLSWAARSQGPVLHVEFRGEIDMSVYDECLAGLEAPFAGTEPAVVIDLGEVGFIDSTGLHLLIKLKKTADSAYKQLLLGRVSQPVLRVLDVAGLVDWFDYASGHPPFVSAELPS